ncbi:MAG TPA: hypothetical protein VFU28_17530 [Vicinamibacterales bacterium]|nr:hypothetical protein [Vicinamibacterales bacterium]
MSTVAEIKAAIDRLSPKDRAELDAVVWPDEETPPRVRQKLAEAAQGQFVPSERTNIDRILDSLE